MKKSRNKHDAAFKAKVALDAMRAPLSGLASQKALVALGLTLGVLGRVAEKLAVYHDVAARLADATETVIRKEFAVTLVDKAQLRR